MSIFSGKLLRWCATVMPTFGLSPKLGFPQITEIKYFMCNICEIEVEPIICSSGVKNCPSRNFHKDELDYVINPPRLLY